MKKSFWQKARLPLGGAVLAVLIGWLTPLGPALFHAVFPPPALTATVDFSEGVCGSFLTPSDQNIETQDKGFGTAGWAARTRAIQASPLGRGGTSVILLTLTGYDKRPVTISNISFEVKSRKKNPGNYSLVSGQCGDETVARYAEVDLDKNPPQIIDSSAKTVSWGADKNTTPIKFPYKIDDTETESLLLIASTNEYVQWIINVDWANGKDSGTYQVDNDGQPFRTAVPPGFEG